MMPSLVISVWLGFFAARAVAMSAILGSNSTNLRNCAQNEPGRKLYGKDKCPCVGIDNLPGYYATQEDFYHVERPVEAGATCEAWDEGKHPACRGSFPPQWCSQSWCYVDPCNCHIEVPPKPTRAGISYQGQPAYWSYKTCGGIDFYSADLAPDSCVMQKTASDCAKNDKCAWNGEICGGKEAITQCSNAHQVDASLHGQEDCRCVGLDGRDTGKAFMYINEKELMPYPPSVGGTCKAWEENHPECQKAGEKPSWCSAKWCFVDPCKCKLAEPPKSVMGPNRAMRFQGKTAFWSYATCGSQDTWTDAQSGKYCTHHKTEAACAKVDRCAWDGKHCLGKALVGICQKQQETGVLGIEAPFSSGTHASMFWLMIFSIIGVIGKL